MTIASTIFQQATQLSPKEKAALVDQLIASLDTPNPQIDKLWAEEAESRLAAYHRGELKTVSLEKVLSKYQ